MEKTAITPTRAQDYPEWYQQVIVEAELAENAPVRGCMVIKPWGYAIWELIQQDLDRRFKATGHVNAYFPLLIPLSYLEKEAEHVEGFAKECAVVTHHRLVPDKGGGLKPDGKLEEPLVIRPTSETIIGAMYAKWIRSYRDLPLLVNQWANVMRWEMRTRLFLRTSEFLWQEGHTAHATSAEAIEETLMILNLYGEFMETVLAIPVIKGEKTAAEKFPGAVTTYCIEAMMQDGKALQAGTSHFLGQNFARSCNIEFLNKEGSLEHVWTTSWGVTTRLIGGLIMTHSDDNGLVLPPRVAPQQIVILPIYRNDEDRETVVGYCTQLKADLEKQYFQAQPLRVMIDDRDIRGGEKSWQWIKKGVPLRVEIGLRDMAADSLILKRRDEPPGEKHIFTKGKLMSEVTGMLASIQDILLAKAQKYTTENTRNIETLEEFINFFTSKNPDTIKGGFASCYAVDDGRLDRHLKPLKVTARCLPVNQDVKPGKCIFTGEEVSRKTVFAKSY